MTDEKKSVARRLFTRNRNKTVNTENLAQHKEKVAQAVAQSLSQVAPVSVPETVSPTLTALKFSAQENIIPVTATYTVENISFDLPFTAPEFPTLEASPAPIFDIELGENEKRSTRNRKVKENKSNANEENNNSLKRTRKRVKVQDDKSAETSSVENVTEDGKVVRRRRRRAVTESSDGVVAPKGSTRLEAKRQRRREGRQHIRRSTIFEPEFLARRESVECEMLVREQNGLNQIAVIEDGVLVEHYVARHTQTSMVGNVYLGRVQNVLPSMEAAFVDIGKGRNAVLYSGEVNWEKSDVKERDRKIEDALKSGDTVLVQVTKDPIGHKGARLTGQVTLAGRHLVLVPNAGAMTGISRKLPPKERTRLKRILKEIVPEEHGVIVRTAAEGATEEQLSEDIKRLIKSWKSVETKSKSSKNAPSLLKGEPELAVRVVRDIFNEDFNNLTISGNDTWDTISDYVHQLSPELEDRLRHWDDNTDIFAKYRVDEQLQKAFDRKVFLPSGGSLVIDRTEAMTVIDVNTGRFTGEGGTLEETVTRNNLEAAEEIVRQLRLRDIGGIIVIDFIDMVFESNRDLVLRRLIECLGRDRTRHQVAEVTSLGLIQMTRKRIGQGLVEAFSTTCESCEGQGYISHANPVEKGDAPLVDESVVENSAQSDSAETEKKQAEVKAALANIAAAVHKDEEKKVKKKTRGEKKARAEKTRNENTAQNNSQEKPERTRKRRRINTKNVEPLAEATDSKPVLVVENTVVTPDMPAAETGKTTSEQKPKRRRVSSAGTITPKTSPTSAIMSFPIRKKNE